MKRPSLFLYFTELIRSIWEWIISIPFLKRYQPKKPGDGHIVFVIPGFLASPTSTRPLRKFLNRIGYQAVDWGLGRNYGRLSQVELLSRKLNEIYKRNHQKITLIGWSLGGIYARELAKKNPHLIRQLFTLGSPFNGVDEKNNASWLYDLINGKNIEIEYLDMIENLSTPAPIPTTAIYSKKDGIVPWQGCMEKIEDEMHQNVEVRGSHFGLGVNKHVLKIIADKI